MSADISLVDSQLHPHRISAFRESTPSRPDGVTICLGGLRFETTCGEWRQLSAAIDQAIANLAPARTIPARKSLTSADVSGIAYQGEIA